MQLNSWTLQLRWKVLVPRCPVACAYLVWLGAILIISVPRLFAIGKQGTELASSGCRVGGLLARSLCQARAS